MSETKLPLPMKLVDDTLRWIMNHPAPKPKKKKEKKKRS